MSPGGVDAEGINKCLLAMVTPPTNGGGTQLQRYTTKPSPAQQVLVGKRHQTVTKSSGHVVDATPAACKLLPVWYPMAERGKWVEPPVTAYQRTKAGGIFFSNLG